MDGTRPLCFGTVTNFLQWQKAIHLSCSPATTHRQCHRSGGGGGFSPLFNYDKSCVHLSRSPLSLYTSCDKLLLHRNVRRNLSRFLFISSTACLWLFIIIHPFVAYWISLLQGTVRIHHSLRAVCLSLPTNCTTSLM